MKHLILGLLSFLLFSCTIIKKKPQSNSFIFETAQSSLSETGQTKLNFDTPIAKEMATVSTDFSQKTEIINFYKKHQKPVFSLKSHFTAENDHQNLKQFINKREIQPESGFSPLPGQEILKAERNAKISFTFGILSILILILVYSLNAAFAIPISVIFGILGIVYGVKSLIALKRKTEIYNNTLSKLLAISGILLSFILLGFYLFVLTYFMFFFP